METDLKKHPTCMIKGCDRLQAASVEIEVGYLDKESYTKIDDRPFMIKVCLEHARRIKRGVNES